jgi:hypothetical protein
VDEAFKDDEDDADKEPQNEDVDDDAGDVAVDVDVEDKNTDVRCEGAKSVFTSTVFCLSYCALMSSTSRFTVATSSREDRRPNFTIVSKSQLEPEYVFAASTNRFTKSTITRAAPAEG